MALPPTRDRAAAAHPVTAHGIENEPSTFSYEGRKKKKKKRARSRSREPVKPTQRTRPGRRAPAYYTSSRRSSTSAILYPFLSDRDGQHKKGFEKTVVALSIYRRV